MNIISRKPNIINGTREKNKIVDTHYKYKNGFLALLSIENICSHTFKLPQRN